MESIPGQVTLTFHELSMISHQNEYGVFKIGLLLRLSKKLT